MSLPDHLSRVPFDLIPTRPIEPAALVDQTRSPVSHRSRSTTFLKLGMHCVRLGALVDGCGLRKGRHSGHYSDECQL